MQLTEEQLIELLHKVTDNIEDFVIDEKKWLKSNLPQETDITNLISTISITSICTRAKEYAKAKYKDKYKDHMYHREVMNVLHTFEDAYKEAIKSKYNAISDSNKCYTEEDLDDAYEEGYYHGTMN